MMDRMVQNINGSDKIDKTYLNRCIRELERWQAPLDGWVCTKVVDVREDDEDACLETCDLCGCDKVRYLHYMEHEEFYEYFIVGCICAGIMEGDILKAEKRDRLLRNRSKRKKNFVKRKWKMLVPGVFTRVYRKTRIYIYVGKQGYKVSVGCKSTTLYKGKPIGNMLTAAYAAFDLADPIEEVMA